jgi:hypothetical protein
MIIMDELEKRLETAFDIRFDGLELDDLTLDEIEKLIRELEPPKRRQRWRRRCKKAGGEGRAQP